MGISFPLLLDDNEAKAVKLQIEHDPSAAFDEGEDGNPSGEGKDEEAKNPFFQVDRLACLPDGLAGAATAERVAKKDAERAAAVIAAAEKNCRKSSRAGCSQWVVRRNGFRDDRSNVHQSKPGNKLEAVRI